MLQKKLNRLRLTALLVLVMVLILGTVYLWDVWLKNVEEVTEEATLIAETAALGINGEMIKELSAIPEDENSLAFRSVKRRLQEYLKLDSNLRFVYLYTIKEGRVYFMGDSEQSDSKDYSPPGQEYVEAEDFYKEVFVSGKTIITLPVTDRWGTWRSVLVPLFDDETGEVFAVLGMDYPAGSWNKKAIIALETALAQVLIIFFLLILVFAAFKRVLKSQGKYSSLVENVPGVVFRCKIDRDWTMEFINEKIKEMTGFPASDFINNKKRSFASIIKRDDRLRVEKTIQNAVAKKQAYNIEYRLKTASGSIIWIKERGKAVYDVYGKPLYLDGVILDISKDKEILAEIKNKQSKIEALNKFMVGRELKMIELKEEIKQLKSKIKQK